MNGMNIALLIERMLKYKTYLTSDGNLQLKICMWLMRPERFVLFCFSDLSL